MRTVSTEALEKLARRMRLKAIEMAYSCGARGAHISGSLSCIEIYAVLYGCVLNLPRDAWDTRDRFVAGKEHARLAEYPAMKAAGLISEAELKAFETDGSLLAGHPRNTARGLEYSSCSLGMALSIAVGKAISAKLHGDAYRVFCLLGDGECNEGVIWESILLAAKYKLDNLTLIIDRNGMCVDGSTEDVLPLGNLCEKLSAFGWKTAETDGHSITQLREAFDTEHAGAPLAIIAHTVKGKGVDFIENGKQWHQAALSEADYQRALVCLRAEETAGTVQ